MKTKKEKTPINNKINLEDLPVGKFADINGSVLYRYKNCRRNHPMFTWHSAEGTWTIEKDHFKSISDAFIKDASGEYHSVVTPIENPQTKHVSHTLGTLRKSLKEKTIDNLDYIENLNILKNYLKSVIVEKED